MKKVCQTDNKRTHVAMVLNLGNQVGHTKDKKPIDFLVIMSKVKLIGTWLQKVVRLLAEEC